MLQWRNMSTTLDQTDPPIVRRPTGAQIHTDRINLKEAESGKLEIVPIPGYLMDGLGSERMLGTGLRLTIRALPIKYQREVQKALYSAFPLVLVSAAVVDRYGTGISLPGVALHFTTIQNQQKQREFAADLAEYEKKLLETDDVSSVEKPLEPEKENVTVDEIATYINEIDRALSDEYDLPSGTRLIDGIAKAVYPIVKETSGVTEDNLAELLMEHLTTADLADLLRAVLNAYGPQPGSLFDRFPTR